jgi:hypothetical protein
MQLLVEIVIGLLFLYFLLGFLFAIPFAVKGVHRIDPAAKGANWRFRLVIIPGTAAFWPLLLKRWASGMTEPPVEKNAHRLKSATNR